MANTIKMPGVTLGTTKAAILTCAVGTQVAVTDLVLFNASGTARTASLFFCNAALGTEQAGPAGIALASGSGHYRFPAKIFLQPGDEIRALADAASAVVATITHAVTAAATPVAKGFAPKGEYAAGTTYVTNDVVSYINGSGVQASYVSSQDGNIGHQPDTSPGFWTVIAKQGATGPAGSALTKATGTDLRALTDDAKYLTAKSQADAIATAALGNTSGTLAIDFGVSGFNPSIIATGTVTLGQHTGIVDQKPVSLEIVQDATGSRGIAANTTYNKFVGGTIPTLSTAAGARDILYGTLRLIGGVGQAHWTGFAKDVK